MDTATKITPNSTLVRILMLTYNRERYIAEAIESVLHQTYQNWQLIIIDDGSTDNTATVVRSYQEPRITYIQHPENAGLHARRKESLTRVDAMTAPYVAVLDSDDIWHSPEKLAEQVEFLERHADHVLVGTFTRLIDQDGNELREDHFETSDTEIRNAILIRNQFTHSGVLMRTTAIEHTTGYQPILAEDLELFLQLGSYGKFANIPQCLISHRIHEFSENDRGIKMASAVHEIIKKHKSAYPNYTRALIKSYLRLTKAKLHI